VQEAMERLTLTKEITQVSGRISNEKRALSSIQNELGRPKRSATPQNRKY
jgi:hypothetical protein